MHLKIDHQSSITKFSILASLSWYDLNVHDEILVVVTVIPLQIHKCSKSIIKTLKNMPNVVLVPLLLALNIYLPIWESKFSCHINLEVQNQQSVHLKQTKSIKKMRYKSKNNIFFHNTYNQHM